MHFFAVFTLLILLSSCSSSLEKANQDFARKYNEEINKINEQRTPDKETKNETLFSAPPTRDEVVKDLARRTEYHPYSDISLIGDAPRAEVLPNREIYELNKGLNPAGTLPKNIFETNYNLALYPPFRKVGAEFDAINIPQKDAFGVSTDLKEKKYLLVGNNSLQRNVDYINSEKTDVNVEVTKMLVAEKKKILRQEKSDQTLLAQPEPEQVFVKDKDQKITADESLSSKAKNAINNVSGFVRSVVTTPNSSEKK